MFAGREGQFQTSKRMMSSCRSPSAQELLLHRNRQALAGRGIGGGMSIRETNFSNNRKRCGLWDKLTTGGLIGRATTSDAISSREIDTMIQSLGKDAGAKVVPILSLDLGMGRSKTGPAELRHAESTIQTAGHEDTTSSAVGHA